MLIFSCRPGAVSDSMCRRWGRSSHPLVLHPGGDLGPSQGVVGVVGVPVEHLADLLHLVGGIAHDLRLPVLIILGGHVVRQRVLVDLLGLDDLPRYLVNVHLLLFCLDIILL